MLNRLSVFWIFLLLSMLGACASPSSLAPVRETGPGLSVVPTEKPPLFGKPSADVLLLNEGFSCLGVPEKEADYNKARISFEALITNHPGSKWRPLAETLIRLINDIQSVQVRSKSEKDQLKRDIQALNVRLQTERAILVQENEKLRKDIELLKKLEVQLDRREKMRR
jgi:hypothetical protein